MNKKQLFTTTALSLALIGTGLHLAVGEGPAITKPAPRLKPEQFQAKLKKDSAPLPTNSGHIVMSYADVAEKIMPSVVRIVSSVPVKGLAGRGFGGGGGFGGLDEDQLREFFKRFAPPGSNPFGSDDEEQPRQRKRGNQRNQDEDNGDEKKSSRPHPSQKGVGSGVIISTDGFILTNNHVVADSEKLEVTVGNDTKSYKATVIGADERTDVALIKIEATNLPAATLGDSTKLRVGDVVLAAGNPMELSQTLTQGIVSAIGRTGQHIIDRNSAMGGIENFIQTDASINPGNSGGPLVDALGRVVGINTAIMTQSGMNAGIGFTIPINLAIRVGEDLVDDGKVTRGFLGIVMAQILPNELKNLGIDADGGVGVREVRSGQAAEKAGIQVGDVIITVDGHNVDNPQGVSSLVASGRPGDIIDMEVVRGKTHKKIKVTLGGATDDQLQAGVTPSKKEDAPPAPAAKKAPAKLIKGMTGQDITDGLRERFDIPKEVAAGIVVVAIEPNTPAAAAGLAEGDVITGINNEKTDNLKQAQKLAKEADGVFGLNIRRGGKQLYIIVREKIGE